jgi:prepilin-type N-terminal cleavage/methylation domain-containing protein
MYRQAGFTLVEIAVVLIIIGLMLGGVLKGQELINSAKTKSLANDFRQVPLFLYGYQDKFRKIPGDDAAAVANIGAPAGHAGNGDGLLGGNWNDQGNGSEAVLFWEHVRLANLASGSTDFASATDNGASLPTNGEGGRIGVQGRPPIAGLKGMHFVCSTGIGGKLARQLDLAMDDGDAMRGAMMAVAATTSTAGSTAATPNPPVAEAYDDVRAYTVCMSL